MEMLRYARDIQDLLVLHDRAVKQILIIDDYIREVNWQALCTAISGNTNQVMHLLLRKSVAEGVKKMYKQYRLQKWFKVQLLVQDITRAHDVDHHEYGQLLPTQIFNRYPELNRLSETLDSTAHSWTVRQCEFSRFC